VDIGQIEGGLVQGLGWMTMEEIVYNDKGKLLSNALSTYKVPDIHSVPKEITIEALPTDGHPLAIRRSKAVGEPPLMYGIGVYFAIQNAVKAANPKYALALRCAVHAGEGVDGVVWADGTQMTRMVMINADLRTQDEIVSKMKRLMESI
jgi:xanthine dehydrogenase molybdopterin-binding subunit B